MSRSETNRYKRCIMRQGKFRDGIRAFCLRLAPMELQKKKKLVLVCSVITSRNFAGDRLVIGNRYHAFRNYGTYCINTITVLAQLVQYDFSNGHVWRWLFQTTLVYFSHLCNNAAFVWQTMMCLPQKEKFKHILKLINTE